MTVCVCIATRGRPNELRETITGALESSVLDGTHFAVAMDDDDPPYITEPYHFPGKSGSAPREHSLGAKYNRAASYAREDATLFVLGVDDAYMSSPGWDEKLLKAASQFEDGFGAVYFGGKQDKIWQLPESMAVTRRWIDEVGFFCPPYFPFWWHDTWIDEIAKMTGRYVWADVEWNKHGNEAGEHKTTRIREVSWWAKFFDDTRKDRIEASRQLIMKLDYPAWLRDQKLSELPSIAAALEMRNSNVRLNGAEYEGMYGAETGIDPGYDILKEQAARMAA